MIKQKALIGAVVLVAAQLTAAVVEKDEFDGAAAPLISGTDWVSRNEFIQLDGAGTATLFGGADSYVKRAIDIPSDAARVRFSARVNAAGLPGSDRLTYHPKGKNPAWVALGLMNDPNPAAGLAGSRLSVVLSSDGTTLSFGLGRSVGRDPQAFGIHEAAGRGWCEVALEYDFRTQMAEGFLNGEKVLSGAISLTPADFRMIGFQLRRIAAPGGVDWLKIETEGSRFDPVVLEPETGVRINAGHERNQALVEKIDGASTPAETLFALKEGWSNPPATYRPHTRWWWPGNAVTKEGITWQLEQMKDKGLGGVEIMSFMKIYDQGNIEFDSPQFVEMVQYTVNECRRLGMEVSLSLGPGWNLGHSRVPDADRAKVLVVSGQDVSGGKQELTLALPQDPPYAKWNKKKPVALVAVARLPGGQLDLSRRIDLSSSVAGFQEWEQNPDIQRSVDLPKGSWRLMTFWIAFTGQRCAAENYEPRSWIVDHLNKDAVRRCVEVMGGKYRQAFGADFGQTVDSFFGDSFELQQDFSFWSDDLFERFEREKGYDLRPYLPLLIHGGAPETPYVRYDFGHFLHQLGMEGTIAELSAYCEEAGIGMRQQPHYRFTAELIEASGALQRPETENSKHSFEPMFWHKLTTSGAWLYPSKEKKWVSAEAFTFVNIRYRTTMEEIKRATDLFLRDGITQFYNHGYFYSPEKEISPSRDLLWMNRISHVNTWWPWYRGLADYQARAAFLSRQGRAETDVLLYSPMPTLWSERAEYPCTHVRDLPFGHLPKTLIANGYDFDCVNDDLLLNHAEIKNGKLVINGYAYSVLILPRVLCLAPETMGKVEQFVQSGGTVFALNTLPGVSNGWKNHEARDAELAAIRDRLFKPSGGDRQVGQGKTCFMPGCDGFDYLKNWRPGTIDWAPTPPLSPAYQKFIAALRSRLTPDFELADKSQSDGLTFRHTVINEIDCWFITNLQPHSRKTGITLKTTGKIPQIWDAMDGSFQTLEKYRFADDGRIIIPVDLEPWQSQFVLLVPEGAAEVPTIGNPTLGRPDRTIELSNPWNVSFQGLENFQTHLTMDALEDWRDLPGLKNFAGTATYRTEFEIQSSINNRQSAIFLDLGEVHEVASIKVNGQEVGNVWMPPYRLDISKQIKPGRNRLEIRVANLLWNYVAGLKEPKPIPENLRAHYGTTWNQKYNGWNSSREHVDDKGNDRLPSGLLGPVQLRIYSK